MGVKCVKNFAFLVFYGLFVFGDCHPYGGRPGSSEAAVSLSSWVGWLFAFAFTATCAVLLLGCLSCCKQRAGFKEFRNSPSEANENNVGLDFVNPLSENVAPAAPSPSRYSIFSSLAGSVASSAKQPDSIVTFEPLPRALQKSNPRLPQFNGDFEGVGITEDWLNDKDFPRQQLHYLRECGQGWFGKVVEGEARGIVASSNKIHRVYVRILKEDATVNEQALFLREAKPYKELAHPNILKLAGRCLENVPFLLVFEACSNGDLKSYLKQNVGNRDALILQGVMLRMSIDIASGLSYMLQHTFIHTDIAARNCLVTGELRVKIGDYGTSLQNYKDEYYFNGDVALPIRWCAPETLKCTDTIEPQQVTGASCIWSYGVLLWELEEWGELPYKDLTNEQVIAKVFGSDGLRLQPPVNKTPCSQEMYDIMKECWKDYTDRPSFIHLINSLSALMHRFKNNDFDSRWKCLKPNTIPVTDNEDTLSQRRIGTLANKSDNDSGIDLDNPKGARGLSMLQLQQGSPRHHRFTNDECSSESPASSRRFSSSSTGDLFPSPISMKHRSPSLENLHGSLDNISKKPDTDAFESSEYSWFREQRMDGVGEEGCTKLNEQTKLDFHLGLVSNHDSDVLWNNKPLFQPDSLQEDNLLTKRIDSLGTDTEDEIWRRRIERGEFTEKVKEKSKSVADLMILTHIDCSESSESDSLPSFHSRQSSFNKQCRRNSKSGAPLSLLNSLSFGSESNLPVVEKDQEFQNTLKKIQIAKINKDDNSLNFISLQTPSLTAAAIVRGDKDGASKLNHFLANEASKTRPQSSHTFADSDDSSSTKKKLPLFDNSLFESERAESTAEESNLDNQSKVGFNFLANEARMPDQGYDVGCSSGNNFDSRVTETLPSPGCVSVSYDMLSSSSSSNEISCSPNDTDSVVLGPSESHTLEYFKGLKTTLVDAKPEDDQSNATDDRYESPRTLNEFLNDTSDDYFYKCDEVRNREPRYRPQYCDYCYVKCHFSNECLRCKDKSFEENCLCESFENLEKFRDCTALNSCPFQSDDSGRGTDQINSGDGSSDKSLEGSISVQMNEVKNRLEDVIAKFNADESDDNCSSLEDDKDILERTDLRDFEEKDNVQVDGVEPSAGDVEKQCSRRGSLFATSENENSASVEEDTCIGVHSRSEDSGNFAEQESSSELSGTRLVKVEQLFFSVDPKLEKEIEELKAVTDEGVKDEGAEAERDENSQEAANLSYEISDILEGLSEPISLPYSVNEQPQDENDEDSSPISSNWLPSPIDDDYKNGLEMDAQFVEAIRNELREKLPNTSTLAIVEPEETSTENTSITIEYSTYPNQLSPILEEEEYSSLSSLRSVSSNEPSDSSISKFYIPDEVLIVDVETNEAAIVDKTITPPPSFMQHRLNETYEIEENDDTIEIADNLDSDSVPTPDSLSPGTSSKTGAQLSYSSSESGNLSDVFLSPSSSKNFDDLEADRSLCDGRHLNTPENILHGHCEKALRSIDQMLERGKYGLDNTSTLQLESTSANFIDPIRKRRDESWLKSFFLPYNDTTSLVDFNSVSDLSEMECRSLPADFKSENWPQIDELVTPEAEQVERGIDVSEFTRKDEGKEEGSTCETSPVVEISSSNENVELPSSSSAFDSTQAKLKNSLALFGNTSKQIRNFQVSLVKDDNYVPQKTSPTSPKNIVELVEPYLSEKFNSEKTWKSSLNSLLSSQNLENFGIKEINASDLMSTSFIESGSQDGSLGDKAEAAEKSDDSDDEGEVDCTSEEFVWKKADSKGVDTQCKTDSEDDEDDEELADFVPFSWNSDAVPQKSALKNKDSVRSSKKNVSFKKQKYHCVYEYPKEEPNYVKTYEDILQERAYGIWQNYLYPDYSSFSDWELDDCGSDEQAACNDDLLPYPGVSATSAKNNVIDKLGFYTIGVYDFENNTKTSASEDNASNYLVSSPSISYLNNSAASSPNHTVENMLSSGDKCVNPNGVSGNENITNVAKNLDLEALKVKPAADEKPAASITNGTNSTSDEYVDLPSPGLGELKHTKNRLKLDLTSKIIVPKPEDKLKFKDETDDEDVKSVEEKESVEESASEDTFEYGLNYKSYDLSPVVELSKSLTSASVA